MARKFQDTSTEEILNDIYKQYHSQLTHQITSAKTLLSINRIYDSGQILELAFKNFFLSILPEYVGITRGVVFDTKFENHSDEIDLIFYDKRYFCGFPIHNQGYDALSYIPIDVVFGVAQVKSTIDMNTLKKSIKNLKTVLCLERRELKNYIHQDINLGDNIIFHEGKELNKIFSCILGGKNDLFYKKGKTDRVEMTDQEIIHNFLEKTKKAQNSSLRKIPIDLMYTIDGSAFVPLRYNSKKNCAELFMDIFTLGNEKEFLCLPRKITPNMPLFYGFKKNFAEPEKFVGISIFYISYWCSKLIKCSPDISKFVDVTFPINPNERWIYEKFFSL